MNTELQDHINKLKDAHMNIEVQGIPNSGQRLQVIEDAIAQIQDDGKKALTAGYLGVKNYAGFGDQREDHSYGMGPRHGSIVFSVGRREKSLTAMGENEIYFLLVARDNPEGFGIMAETQNCYPAGKGRPRSLTVCLAALIVAEDTQDEMNAHLAKAMPCGDAK